MFYDTIHTAATIMSQPVLEKVVQEIARWIRDDAGAVNSFIAGGSAGYLLSAIQCELHCLQ